MSTLYEDSHWSKRDITAVTGPIKTEMIQRHEDMLSTEKISYYRKEMKQKEKEGHLVSYVDMWGLVIEHLIYGKVLQGVHNNTGCGMGVGGGG